MPLKVIGFESRDFLSILPLGIKMFTKGKMPNPLEHRDSGFGARVRHLFGERTSTPLQRCVHGRSLPIS